MLNSSNLINRLGNNAVTHRSEAVNVTLRTRAVTQPLCPSHVHLENVNQKRNSGKVILIALSYQSIEGLFS